MNNDAPMVERFAMYAFGRSYSWLDDKERAACVAAIAPGFHAMLVHQTPTGERPMMRAKIRINSVQHSETQDVINGSPVTSSPYDAEGNSEDNTYARYTPSGSLSLTINNPALVGKIQQGDVFYVDFTKAE